MFDPKHTLDGMSQRLSRFALLVVLSGSCYSAPKDDVPIDIFEFSVHGNGAEQALRPVEEYGLRAHLHCVHDRTRILGAVTSIEIPGVDCAISSGEFVLRAEVSFEDPPTHAFVYTYNHFNDPHLTAIVGRIVATLMTAAKASLAVDHVQRKCCTSLNRRSTPHADTGDPGPR